MVHALGGLGIIDSIVCDNKGKEFLREGRELLGVSQVGQGLLGDPGDFLFGDFLSLELGKSVEEVGIGLVRDHALLERLEELSDGLDEFLLADDFDVTLIDSDLGNFGQDEVVERVFLSDCVGFLLLLVVGRDEGGDAGVGDSGFGDKVTDAWELGKFSGVPEKKLKYLLVSKSLGKRLVMMSSKKFPKTSVWSCLRDLRYP